MFLLHARAKYDLTKKLKTDFDYPPTEESRFVKEISQVRNQVEGLVKDLDLEYVAPLRRHCQESIQPLAGKIDYRQPYTALVLADLILARGSPTRQ